MRPREDRFEVIKGSAGKWWVTWKNWSVRIAGPYRVKRSARYVAGLLNETLDREPLEGGW